MEDWIQRQLIERQQPVRSPVMFQRWTRLLFLHWSIHPGISRGLCRTVCPWTHLREGLDRIVPFFMRGVRPAGFLAIPGISNFLELNLRTYVRDVWAAGNLVLFPGRKSSLGCLLSQSHLRAPLQICSR